MRTIDHHELARHEDELARSGYTIVPDMLCADEADAVLAVLGELHARAGFGDNDFTGFRTKRIFNLFAKTRALDPLLTQADIVRLIESRLGDAPQLSIASTMEIHSGETVQTLHQDDFYFPAHPHPTLVINTIWALSDFTRANGATRLVPGSHLSAEPIDRDAPWVAAEMPRGSVLLRDGLPEAVQKLLGFNICQFVGWVDGRHPMRAIVPEDASASGQASARCAVIAVSKALTSDCH